MQESSFFEISKFAGFRPQLFFCQLILRDHPCPTVFCKNAREARRVVNCSAHTQYMSANLRCLPGVLVFFCFSYPRVSGAGQKKDPPGYYNTEPDRVSREILKIFKKSYPQDFHRISTGRTIDLHEKILIMYIMKNENKRPTKKALVKQLEDRGVDKAIVASLQRANIDTLQWVLKQIS